MITRHYESIALMASQMAALAVFQQVGKVADTDFLALAVLPCLWSLSLGPLLNLEQFQHFMALIKSLSTKIEENQNRKLQELSNNRSSTLQATRNSSYASADTNGTTANGVGNEETDFEFLVTGRKANMTPDLFDSGWSSQPALRPNGTSSTQQQAAHVPTFSWSSNPQTQSSMPPQRTTAQTSAGSGTVTPDSMMNSYASLTPMSNYATGAQPLYGQSPQPQYTGNTGIGAAASKPIDWTRASNMSNTGTTQPLSPSQAISQQRPVSNTSAYSHFTIAPPPKQTLPRTNGITPSVGSATRTKQANTTQNGSKQGLDRYESLI